MMRMNLRSKYFHSFINQAKLKIVEIFLNHSHLHSLDITLYIK